MEQKPKLLDQMRDAIRRRHFTYRTEQTYLSWAPRYILFHGNEMMARYASYADAAEVVRHRFTEPRATLQELFARIVFNILSGNTDDHARNHAAFWDGKTLTLTPAYDICPQGRSGQEAGQAMLITEDNRSSRLVTGSLPWCPSNQGQPTSPGCYSFIPLHQLFRKSPVKYLWIKLETKV